MRMNLFNTLIIKYLFLKIKNYLIKYYRNLYY